MPLVDILSFRNKCKKSLSNFRRSIRSLTRQVGTGLDTAEKQKKFKEIITDEVLPVKGEIESKLSENDIAFGFSAFDIAQAGVVGAISSGGQSWLTGIAGAAISLTVSLVRSLREDRNIIRDHPFGYLYTAQKKFGRKE